MENTGTAENAIPSMLMDRLRRLRGTSIELRSRLNVVLTSPSPELNKTESSVEKDLALDVIAATQDVLGDIMERLIV